MRQRAKHAPLSGQFSDKYIKSLPHATEDEKEYSVREGHGFTIRVLASGTKTFWFIYTYNGKRRRMNLGTYKDGSRGNTTLAEARTKYQAAALQVAAGNDPMEPSPEPESLPEEMTVLGLAKEYLESLTIAEESIKQQRRILNHDIFPLIGKTPVKDVTRRQAIKIIEDLAKRVPGSARNAMKTCRSMWTYAYDREMVAGNPWAKIPVKAIKPKSKVRVLSDEEIIKVWPHLIKSLTGRAVLLVLVTAQRPKEIAAMEWHEIKGLWWTNPAGRRKKTETDNLVWITNLATYLIPEFKLHDQYVFPGLGKGKHHGKYSGPLTRGSMSQLISTKDHFGLPNWGPHDLRRTVKTNMARMKIPAEVSESVLGHVKKGMDKVYNVHEYTEEKALALEQWSDHLQTILAEAWAKEAAYYPEPDKPKPRKPKLSALR